LVCRANALVLKHSCSVEFDTEADPTWFGGSAERPTIPLSALAFNTVCGNRVCEAPIRLTDHPFPSAAPHLQLRAEWQITINRGRYPVANVQIRVTITVLLPALRDAGMARVGRTVNQAVADAGSGRAGLCLISGLGIFVTTFFSYLFDRSAALAKASVHLLNER
jgi:hypothetical protein